MLLGVGPWSKAKCIARLSEAREHWIFAGTGLAIGAFVGITSIPLSLHLPNRLDAFLYAIFGSALLIWLVGGIPDLKWPRFEAFFFGLIVSVYLIGIGMSLRLALTSVPLR
jgi:hypothetical protein